MIRSLASVWLTKEYKYTTLASASDRIVDGVGAVGYYLLRMVKDMDG